MKRSESFRSGLFIGMPWILLGLVAAFSVLYQLLLARRKKKQALPDRRRSKWSRSSRRTCPSIMNGSGRWTAS